MWGVSSEMWGIPKNQLVLIPMLSSSFAAASYLPFCRQLKEEFPNLAVLRPSAYVMHLQSKIRDASTNREDFVKYSNKLLRILCGEALDHCPTEPVVVQTPTSSAFQGVVFSKPICGVSILRSGSCMEEALRDCVPDVAIGKILCQRDESKEDKPAILYYSKLPSNIAEYHVVLLDPMLATGGSAKAAMQVLIDAGVPEASITFINLVSCPEGIKAFFAAYPQSFLVTAAIDDNLNDDKYIIPGLGDMGDRYFGTT